jgi:TonB family protein
MRKVFLSRGRCLSETLLSFAALGLASLSVFAQGAGPALPSDPTAFMVLAGQANLLSQMGDQTWHLKVSFKVFDDEGNIKDQGTYDEYYVSPKKSTSSYSTAKSSRTEYNTEAGRFFSGAQILAYPLLGQLRAVYVYPGAAMALTSRLDLASDIREINGTKYVCIAVNTRPTSPDIQPKLLATYCFDGPPDTLRIAFFDSYQGPYTIVRSHPIAFEGRSLAGDIEMKLAGKLALTAHIETIAPVTPSDEAVFTPPADAIPFQIRTIGVKGSSPNTTLTIPTGRMSISGGVAQGLLVEKTQPVYPPVAVAARVQGTVVLQAVINKEGHVEDLRVVSGMPLLQQAATDAVKQWVYRPYLLNGEPVEVLTTVNVVFSLSQPAKKENPSP